MNEFDVQDNYDLFTVSSIHGFKASGKAIGREK
jgi:hypothetical protein